MSRRGAGFLKRMVSHLDQNEAFISRFYQRRGQWRVICLHACAIKLSLDAILSLTLKQTGLIKEDVILRGTQQSMESPRAFPHGLDPTT